MLFIPIPGGPSLSLQHLVLDYNGTLAQDGVLLAGVADVLLELAGYLHVHVLTADTFGKAASQIAGLPCTLEVLPPGVQDRAKRDYVVRLGEKRCVAVGNGRNDGPMLKVAALGICVVQGEGAAVSALQAADVVVPDVLAALNLLRHPRRLMATLRT